MYTFINTYKIFKICLLQKSNLLKNKTHLGTNQGVIRKEKSRGYLNINFKNGSTNVEYVLMSLTFTSIFYIPGKTITFNVSTWSSRWGPLIWTTSLDWRKLVWPWTASWPLHKDHSGHTEVLKTSKLWHGFKFSPILADLCHISFLWGRIKA